MSMIGNLLRVSAEELETFIEDSSLLESKIYPEDEVEGEGPNLLDIDKAWDGIFYLLTGCTLDTADQAKPPLSWVVFGSYVVDEEQDMGYGPAGFNLPEQVKEISKVLEALPVKALQANYNAAKMQELEVYPSVWVSDPEAFDYLAEYYESLREFYKTAAQNGEAVITFLN